MEQHYNVLITYDIDSKHTDVRKSLIEEHGFEEVIIGNSCTTCYLPNTTLYQKNTTKERVLNTLKSVCAANKAKLKRAISVECSNWQALVGEKM